jgi:hypothetical protein
MTCRINFAEIFYEFLQAVQEIFEPKGSHDAVYALREFRAPISTAGRIYVPFIVPLVFLKDFEKPVFETLWKRCTSALSTAKRVVFLVTQCPRLICTPSSSFGVVLTIRFRANSLKRAGRTPHLILLTLSS